jgi:hypothetical protein
VNGYELPNRAAHVQRGSNIVVAIKQIRKKFERLGFTTHYQMATGNRRSHFVYVIEGSGEWRGTDTEDIKMVAKVNLVQSDLYWRTD